MLQRVFEAQFFPRLVYESEITAGDKLIVFFQWQTVALEVTKVLNISNPSKCSCGINL